MIKKLYEVRILAAYISVIFLLFACQSNKNDIVEYKTFYPNGMLKSSVLVDTITKSKEGVTKYYYSNGNLSALYNFVGNLKHGEFKTFYENGCKYSEGFFWEGELHGLIITYSKDGHIRRKTEYARGIKNKIIEFYDNEAIKLIKDFKGRVLKYYNKEEKLISETEI